MATVGDQLRQPEAGWKRYDNTRSEIQYSGGINAWVPYTSASLNMYNNTGIQSNTAKASISFKFYGTMFRIIGRYDTDKSSNIKVEIDGVDNGPFSQAGASLSQVINFDSGVLTAGIHDVKLTNMGQGFLFLDAIDINDTGEITGSIGQQLLQPEVGWKRYDDGNPSIRYFGTFVREPNANFYNGASNYATSTDFKMKFEFIGTRIRIIGNMYQNKFPNVPITIDGVTETFSQYGNLKFQALQYEKTGLENIKHTVEITLPSDAGSIGYDPNNMNVRNIQIDAIDIDEHGRLLHPDEVTELKELIVGKRIRAHYTVLTSGQVGAFNGLGQETSDFIPSASGAITNGDFYFIMYEDWNGKKKLCADRNVQHSISWDTLNSLGAAAGSGTRLPINNVYLNVASNAAISNYGLTATSTLTNIDYRYAKTTMAHKSGKHYFEFTFMTTGSGGVGIVDSNRGIPTGTTGTASGSIYYRPTGSVNVDGKDFSSGTPYTYNDVIGVGIDMDSKTVIFYKNGVIVYTVSFPFTSVAALVRARNTWTANFSFKKETLKYLPDGYLPYDSYDQTHLDLSYIFNLRLLTGGTSANDKENEWDKYITDDRIWNNANHGSWTSTTDQSNPSARVIRGYNGLTNWTSGSTNLTTPGRGFRPVLLIEPINNSKILVLDGTDVKTYTSSGWETIGTTPPTDDMFLNKGMLDLSTCTPFLKDLIDKSNLKILVSKPKREPTVAHLTGVPIPRIVKMKNDVSFLSTSKINALALSGTEKGVLRVAISTDSGTTWEAKQYGGSWTIVDVNNPINFKENAMTIDDFNSIPDWDERLGQARNLRCAFYFEQPSSTDETSLDSLTMDVDFLNSWDIAMPGVDYKYGYNRDTNLRVLLLSNGDYKINVGSDGSSGSTLTEVDGGTF